MADTTISGLSQGIPNKSSAIIPYSDGTTTLRTAPSGIVAASPGSVLQIVRSSDIYFFSELYNTVNAWVPGLSATITPKSSTSTILIDIDAHVLLFANNTTKIGQVIYGAYRIKKNSTEIYADIKFNANGTVNDVYASTLGGFPYYGNYYHNAIGLRKKYIDKTNPGLTPTTYSFDVMLPFDNRSGSGFYNQQGADLIRVRGGSEWNSYIYLYEIAG